MLLLIETILEFIYKKIFKSLADFFLWLLSELRNANRGIVVLLFLIVLLLFFILGRVIFPDSLRLDKFTVISEPEIMNDFIYGQFQYYIDEKSIQKNQTGKKDFTERYINPRDNKEYTIFDKMIVIEHVNQRYANENYEIRANSTGADTEIIAISPPISIPEYKTSAKGNSKGYMSAKLDLSVVPKALRDDAAKDIQIKRIYRNGYQGRNSYAGKDVQYKTDKLVLVYDFSNLFLPDKETVLVSREKNIFAFSPEACVEREGKIQENINLDYKYTPQTKMLSLTAYNLEKNDRVRVFWTWSSQPTKVECKEAMGF